MGKKLTAKERFHLMIEEDVKTKKFELVTPPIEGLSLVINNIKIPQTKHGLITWKGAVTGFSMQLREIAEETPFPEELKKLIKRDDDV